MVNLVNVIYFIISKWINIPVTHRIQQVGSGCVQLESWPEHRLPWGFSWFSSAHSTTPPRVKWKSETGKDYAILIQHLRMSLQNETKVCLSTTQLAASLYPRIKPLHTLQVWMSRLLFCYFYGWWRVGGHFQCSVVIQRVTNICRSYIIIVMWQSRGALLL